MRNVLIAIGNSKLKDAKDHLNKNIFDESPIVRGAAIWALNQITEGEELNKIKKQSLSLEKAPDVIKEWIERKI